MTCQEGSTLHKNKSKAGDISVKASLKDSTQCLLKVKTNYKIDQEVNMEIEEPAVYINCLDQ